MVLRRLAVASRIVCIRAGLGVEEPGPKGPGVCNGLADVFVVVHTSSSFALHLER